MNSAWWPAIREGLALPWIEEAACMDLRWHDARARMGVEGMPTRRTLLARWGWTEWATRALMAAQDRWADPVIPPNQEQANADNAAHSAQPPNRRPTAAQPPPNTERSNAENDGDSAQPPPSRRPGISLTRASLNTTTPQHHKTHTPIGAEPGPSESVQSWVPSAAQCKPSTRPEVERMVLACIEAIHQRPATPSRAGTDARCVLALWRATGRALGATFLAEVEVVARWARESPEPAASRAIRAEGWDEGQDRSRSVASLCRQAQWSDRLEAARKWAAAPPTDSTPGSSDGSVDAVWSAWRDHQAHPAACVLRSGDRDVIRRALGSANAEELAGLIRYVFEADEPGPRWLRGENPQGTVYTSLDALFRAEKLSGRIQAATAWAASTSSSGDNGNIGDVDLGPLGAWRSQSNGVGLG